MIVATVRYMRYMMILIDVPP